MEFHDHLSVQDRLVEGYHFHIFQLPIFLTQKLSSSSSMHVHAFAGGYLLLRYITHLMLQLGGPLLLRGDSLLPRHSRIRNTVCVYAFSLHERIM